MFKATKIWLIILIYFNFLQLNGQTIYRGNVYDAVTQEPLPGVILEDGSSNTSTDADGFFQIQTTDNEVIFHYLGYEDEVLQLGSGKYYDVFMKQLSITNPEIVVSATPLEFQTPVPLSILKEQELQQFSAMSIAPVLNTVSGIYMHSGALNTNRITIRGIGNRSLFSTTKIRAYLDDIPLTSGIGETTIEDIDLSILRQVEVYKGPTASQYGAGLGGMIHLKTQNKTGIQPSSLSTDLTIGSYGLLRNVNRFTYQSEDQKVNLELNYNYAHSDGYRANNEYNRHGLSALAQIYPNEKSSFTILTNHTDVKAFIPSSLNREDYDNNPEKAAFTWQQVNGFEDYEKTLIGLSHQYKFSQQFENTTSIFTNFRNNYESRPFNILIENSEAIGGRTKFLYRPDIPEVPMTFTLGTEFFNEDYAWKTYVTNEGTLGATLSDAQEQRQYINVFAEGETSLSEKWSVIAGLNINKTNYDILDLFAPDSLDLTGTYTFSTILSPRLGINYLHQEDNQTLSAYFTMGQGFSPPTLEETLTPEGAINPNIQPETGWNYEVGVRGQTLLKRLRYDLSIYTMRIKDLLVARRTGDDQFVGINAGKTVHNGLEALLDYSFLQSEQWQGNIYTNYTFADYIFKEFVDGDNDYSGNELTGTPPHLLNVGLNIRHTSGWYANWNHRYVASFPMRDDNSIYSDAYQVSRLKIGWQKTLQERWQLHISGGINNVWEEQYAAMILINAGSFGGNAPRYYYPGLPRNFYGQLGIKYLL